MLYNLLALKIATNSLTKFFIVSLTLFLSSACTDKKTAEKSTPITDNAASFTTQVIETEKWLGQWNGPEGTFLKLTGGDGKYEIIISNLDGPRTFSGVSVGNQIQFERDGIKESIRATSGEETGMKWLSDKTDCLTIKSGEGYCR
jgi:hypothetical protein